MNIIIKLSTLAFSLSGACVFAQDKAPAAVSVPSTVAKEAAKTESPKIQIAILLDTSSSMDGLIDQTRTYLWSIVNEMTLAKQNGKLPNIEIALYEYGNDGLSDDSQWIRQVSPLSNDLDNISAGLFKLKTYGGSEYCGAAIRHAVKNLKWSPDVNDLKMIYIAGNEPFTQGNVSYKDAIKDALDQGVTVNTILCSYGADLDSKGWKEGAKLGDGSFFEIDANNSVPDPPTPMDKKIVELGESINKTYIAYGDVRQRREKAEMQFEQDKNVQGLTAPQAAIGRAKMKANKQAYQNTSWDLVDAFQDNAELNLDELAKSDQLPEELKGKTKEEIQKVIAAKQEERAKIQQEITELNHQRAKWLKDNAEKNQKAGAPKTLNDAIIQSAQAQAEKKNFKFEKK